MCAKTTRVKVITLMEVVTPWGGFFLVSNFQNTVSSKVESYAYHGENPMTLGGLTVYGIQNNVTKLTVNGTDWQFFTFNISTKVIDFFSSHFQFIETITMY